MFIKQKIMERIGLNMHVGNGEKKSNTEAMFFPSREAMQSWIEENLKKLPFLLHFYKLQISSLLKYKSTA